MINLTCDCCHKQFPLSELMREGDKCYCETCFYEERVDNCDHCDYLDPNLILYISRQHRCCWLCESCLDDMFGEDDEDEG